MSQSRAPLRKGVRVESNLLDSILAEQTVLMSRQAAIMRDGRVKCVSRSRQCALGAESDGGGGDVGGAGSPPTHNTSTTSSTNAREQSEAQSTISTSQSSTPSTILPRLSPPNPGDFIITKNQERSCGDGDGQGKHEKPENQSNGRTEASGDVPDVKSIPNVDANDPPQAGSCIIVGEVNGEVNDGAVDLSNHAPRIKQEKPDDTHQSETPAIKKEPPPVITEKPQELNTPPIANGAPPPSQPALASQPTPPSRPPRLPIKAPSSTSNKTSPQKPHIPLALVQLNKKRMEIKINFSLNENKRTVTQVDPAIVTPACPPVPVLPPQVEASVLPVDSVLGDLPASEVVASEASSVIGCEKSEVATDCTTTVELADESVNQKQTELPKVSQVEPSSIAPIVEPEESDKQASNLKPTEENLETPDAVPTSVTLDGPVATSVATATVSVPIDIVLQPSENSMSKEEVNGQEGESTGDKSKHKHRKFCKHGKPLKKKRHRSRDDTSSRSPLPAVTEVIDEKHPRDLEELESDSQEALPVELGEKIASDIEPKPSQLEDNKKDEAVLNFKKLPVTSKTRSYRDGKTKDSDVLYGKRVESVKVPSAPAYKTESKRDERRDDRPSRKDDRNSKRSDPMSKSDDRKSRDRSRSTRGESSDKTRKRTTSERRHSRDESDRRSRSPKRSRRDQKLSDKKSARDKEPLTSGSSSKHKHKHHQHHATSSSTKRADEIRDRVEEDRIMTKRKTNDKSTRSPERRGTSRERRQSDKHRDSRTTDNRHKTSSKEAAPSSTANDKDHNSTSNLRKLNSRSTTQFDIYVDENSKEQQKDAEKSKETKDGHGSRKTGPRTPPDMNTGSRDLPTPTLDESMEVDSLLEANDASSSIKSPSSPVDYDDDSVYDPGAPIESPLDHEDIPLPSMPPPASSSKDRDRRSSPHGDHRERGGSDRNRSSSKTASSGKASQSLPPQSSGQTQQPASSLNASQMIATLMRNLVPSPQAAPPPAPPNSLLAQIQQTLSKNKQQLHSKQILEQLTSLLSTGGGGGGARGAPSTITSSSAPAPQLSAIQRAAELTQQGRLTVPGIDTSGSPFKKPHAAPSSGHHHKSARNKSASAATVASAAKQSDSDQSDDMLDSAMSLNNRERYMEKLHRQERANEEVKQALKPYYSRKDITKDEYKEIMCKAVPKICHSRTGVINPDKVRGLVETYIKKAKHARRKAKRATATTAIGGQPGPPNV